MTTRLNALSCPEAHHDITFDVQKGCRVIHFHCRKIDITKPLPPDLGFEFAVDFPQCKDCFFCPSLDAVNADLQKREWPGM